MKITKDYLKALIREQLNNKENVYANFDFSEIYKSKDPHAFLQKYSNSIQFLEMLRTKKDEIVNKAPRQMRNTIENAINSILPVDDLNQNQDHNSDFDDSI